MTTPTTSRPLAAILVALGLSRKALTKLAFCDIPWSFWHLDGPPAFLHGPKSQMANAFPLRSLYHLLWSIHGVVRRCIFYVRYAGLNASTGLAPSLYSSYCNTERHDGCRPGFRGIPCSCYSIACHFPRSGTHDKSFMSKH